MKKPKGSKYLLRVGPGLLEQAVARREPVDRVVGLAEVAHEAGQRVAGRLVGDHPALRVEVCNVDLHGRVVLGGDQPARRRAIVFLEVQLRIPRNGEPVGEGCARACVRQERVIQVNKLGDIVDSPHNREPAKGDGERAIISGWTAIDRSLSIVPRVQIARRGA